MIIVLWVLVVVSSVAVDTAVPRPRRWLDVLGAVNLAAFVALAAVAGQWAACGLAAFLLLALGLLWWLERRS